MKKVDYRGLIFWSSLGLILTIVSLYVASTFVGKIDHNIEHFLILEMTLYAAIIILAILHNYITKKKQQYH